MITARSPSERRFVESSARSRGFKFAVLSGLAAYLAKANKVFVPESGQGALGPAIVTVGQAYEDFRNHPRFTKKMSAFLKALLGATTLSHRVMETERAAKTWLSETWLELHSGEMGPASFTNRLRRTNSIWRTNSGTATVAVNNGT